MGPHRSLQACPWGMRPLKDSMEAYARLVFIALSRTNRGATGFHHAGRKVDLIPMPPESRTPEAFAEDLDFHVTTQCIEKLDEPFGGEAGQLAPTMKTRRRVTIFMSLLGFEAPLATSNYLIAAAA